jgi:hypothetical protein
LCCSCKPVFCSHVTLTGYPLHSLVSPSLLLPCVTMCHHISNAVYYHILRNRLRNAKQFRFTWSSKHQKLRRWVITYLCCACVPCPSLCCGFSSRNFRPVRSFLCTTHITHRPWVATDIIYLNRGVDISGRN